jgi:hypothetical protein
VTLDDVDLDGRHFIHPQDLIAVEVGLLFSAIYAGRFLSNFTASVGSRVSALRGESDLA